MLISFLHNSLKSDECGTCAIFSSGREWNEVREKFDILKELAGLASQLAVKGTQKLSVIGVFTSLAIVTDYAMVPIPNVKLVFTLTFASAYSFGFKIGAAVAILTELIWGTISPEGFGGLIIPFLVAANIIYVVAGWGASKIWGYDIQPISSLNIFFGSILAVCAFLWDTATNFGTAILIVWPHVTVAALLYYEGFGIPFMVFHELGDFILGSALAPVIIVYFLRLFRRQQGKLPMNAAREDSRISGTKTSTTQL